MAFENTQKIRTEILNKIKTDGVRLSEFTKEQQSRIIKTYTSVALPSKLEAAK